VVLTVKSGGEKYFCGSWFFIPDEKFQSGHPERMLGQPNSFEISF
jgi:hypothetical protein